MKAIIALILFAAPGLISAQQLVLPFDSVTRLVCFKKVVENPSASAIQRYTQALTWVSQLEEHFDILAHDAQAGEITCKLYGFLKTGNHTLAGIDCNLSIFIRHGKAKIVLTNFRCYSAQFHVGTRAIEAILEDTLVGDTRKQMMIESMQHIEDVWITGFEQQMKATSSDW
jgi:hypothetical protein